MSYHKLKVAVIGAGASGLCAAHHLLARPQIFAPPVVYELSDCVGGTWVYTDRVGKDDNGLPLHSSMYRDLRTNLPKEVMSFPDFPFDIQPPSFIHHSDVKSYLERYTDHFEIQPHIKFCTYVELLNPVFGTTGDARNSWEVTSLNLNSHYRSTERFDSVIVCNGHYSDPFIPHIPEIEHFKGQKMHSHEYRFAEPFTGKNLVLLGAGPSGIDIALELCPVANQVVLVYNHLPISSPLPPNFLQVKGLNRFSETGVICNDGMEYPADTFMFCTGYNYSFPFLGKEVGLKVKDHRITPLYKHIVHTTFPTLFFIGLCKTVCPFPLFHNQVTFVLASLDGTYKLPSKAEMDAVTEHEYQSSLQSGSPHRHFHKLDSLQWSYIAELAHLSKTEPIPPVTRDLYEANRKLRKQDLQNYKRFNYKIVSHDTWITVKPKPL
ncbi:flavin-containing monooxygenase FMO GS-OX-like 2 isoform X1 [Carcharodon carcharias]|uniref:flavin-containing monooxygenase FMO GS-OX-like 2 isoform X1 n=2 Tax=Carcharodon carcharias TaxID=13397 RepID=UPI001B7DA43B|nr:flavin-containing monooxygenase FMO GS-OX-like 2 isoform X1 [Carcharodon carcharias]